MYHVVLEMCGEVFLPGVYYLFVINLIIYLCCVKTGISELLNAVKIFESSYHSIAVHFQPECKVLRSYDRAFLMFIIINTSI